MGDFEGQGIMGMIGILLTIGNNTSQWNLILNVHVTEEMWS